MDLGGQCPAQCVLSQPRKVASRFGAEDPSWEKQLPAHMPPLVGPAPNTSGTRFGRQREGQSENGLSAASLAWWKEPWLVSGELGLSSSFLPDTETSGNSSTAKTYCAYSVPGLMRTLQGLSHLIITSHWPITVGEKWAGIGTQTIWFLSF